MIYSKSIDEIQELLEIALLKRGITTSISIMLAGNKNHIIFVESEPFQTTPVLFKSLRITHSGGSITEEIINGRDIATILIPIFISCHSFENKGFETPLFSFSCVITDGEISQIVVE